MNQNHRPHIDLSIDRFIDLERFLSCLNMGCAETKDCGMMQPGEPHRHRAPRRGGAITQL